LDIQTPQEWLADYITRYGNRKIMRIKPDKIEDAAEKARNGQPITSTPNPATATQGQVSKVRKLIIQFNQKITN